MEKPGGEMVKRERKTDGEEEKAKTTFSSLSLRIQALADFVAVVPMFASRTVTVCLAHTVEWQ